MNAQIEIESPAAGSLRGMVLPIAVLCVSKKSVYHGMKGVEAYDEERGARNFPGGMAVVAHPPCRAWSAYYAHQAKPEVGEKELGLWCVEQVNRWGGILEQPAHSRLWDAAKLPKPGWTHARDSWSMEVWQVWWGYPQLKRTWLYFANISPLDVRTPLQLHSRGRDKRTWQLMSKTTRSKTFLPFAVWLVTTASHVGQNA